MEYTFLSLQLQLMNNEEITNIVKILGLQYSKKYSESVELHSLRYGKLLIMTDQDQDGSHIKGLVINFLHHNWPSLIRHSFVQEFITPIVKVNTHIGELSCCTVHYWIRTFLSIHLYVGIHSLIQSVQR